MAFAWSAPSHHLNYCWPAEYWMYPKLLTGYGIFTHHTAFDNGICNMLSRYFPGPNVLKYPRTWWRHQIEAFSVLLAVCAGSSPVTGEFPAQRPVTRSYDAFFNLRLNKRLSKQLWGWWLDTPSHPLWRYYNEQRTWYRTIRHITFELWEEQGYIVIINLFISKNY